MVRTDLATAGTATAVPEVIARGVLFADAGRFQDLKEAAARRAATLARPRDCEPGERRPRGGA
jgi:hypothetical protein